jgi:hypothetical protein
MNIMEAPRSSEHVKYKSALGSTLFLLKAFSPALEWGKNMRSIQSTGRSVAARASLLGLRLIKSFTYSRCVLNVCAACRHRSFTRGWKVDSDNVSILNPPRMYPYFGVVAGLAWSYNPESFAGGSSCY